MPEFWENTTPLIKYALPRGVDRSDQQCLVASKLSDSHRTLARAFVEGFHAADLNEMSQQPLTQESIAADQIRGNRTFRLLNGYGTLVESMYQQLSARYINIYLERPVYRIGWKEGYVEAHVKTLSSPKRYCAQVAILTPPPAPLKEIQFEPKLKSKLKALEGLGQGNAIKIIVRFREHFWERKLGFDLSFIHSNEKYFPTWWSSDPFRWPLLTGWTGGPSVKDLSGCSSSEIQSVAICSLARILQMRRKTVEDSLQSLVFQIGNLIHSHRGPMGIFELAKLRHQSVMRIPYKTPYSSPEKQRKAKD